MLVDSLKEKEQYRYVLMEFGDMCAVIAGTQIMPEWFVASWDTPLQVSSVNHDDDYVDSSCIL